MRSEDITAALSVLRTAGLTLKECNEIAKKIGERIKTGDNSSLPTTKDIE